MPSEQGSHSTAGAAAFAPTHWTAVFLARGKTPEAESALENLCRTYWPPIYAFIRRQGRSPAEAQDLTQAFILHLLETNALVGVERGKGKFRSFLLASLRNFLANEWDKTKAQKRGGGTLLISLDQMSGENPGDFDLPDAVTPEVIFERRWAESLIDVALSRLEEDYTVNGKVRIFEELKGTLMEARSAVRYVELARRLGTTEASVRVAVHRLRQRYREILRAEIANTVSTPAEVDDEIRKLFAVLSS